MKRRSTKVGLPPGTLVHIGERKAEEPRITLLSYDETQFHESEARSIEECILFKEKPTVTWINIDGLHDVKIMESLGECYGLHPLVLEDILNTDQRPKLEDYGGYLYIVLQMLDRSRPEEVTTEQVSLILGPNFVFSFQESLGDVFKAVRDRIRSGKGLIRKMGADYLAHALMDVIVDGYFVVMEALGERVESLEERLLSEPTPESLKAIYRMRGEMITVRRAVWPLREVIGNLQRGESRLVEKNTVLYLRDVYDHTIQVIDTVEIYRERLSEMIDIYLSSVSFRLNEVMKVLTIIATIFMPLTFLAGVYGMNFKYMPELRWPWAYPACWVVMIGIGASMLVYFRRKKWL